MAALLAYVREGDVVIVAAIDRLGRNTIDVLCTVEALKAKGVSVVSMREGFDLATPAGKLMLTMLAAVAELERENLKARQLAGLERAKAEGKALGRTKALTMPPSAPGVPRTPPASRRRRSTSAFRRRV
jgi:DNA invertase Pin-like site-specific DNA recombinase